MLYVIARDSQQLAVRKQRGRRQDVGITLNSACIAVSIVGGCPEKASTEYYREFSHSALTRLETYSNP